MKRIACFLAAATLSAVGLSACAQPEAAACLANAADSEAASRISAHLYEKEYFSSDGKMLLGKYSYTVPGMASSADDGSSAAIVEAFNDEIDSLLEAKIESWDDAMEDAREFYESGGSTSWADGIYWMDEMSYTANQSEALVDVRYEHYVYSGGAHGYTYYTSQMFALKEGCPVTLAEMAADEESLRKTVADEILRQIEAEDLAVQYSYWSDYAAYVNEWMDDHSVYFLPEEEGRGMEIIFPAYELASYAAGPQRFVVDAAVYEPCLNDYGRLLLGLADA